MYSYNDTIKDIRKAAKKNGLTFKKQNATINSMQAYMFTSRKNGLVIASNFTLNSAYENVLSGYIDSLKH